MWGTGKWGHTEWLPRSTIKCPSTPALADQCYSGIWSHILIRPLLCSSFSKSSSYPPPPPPFLSAGTLPLTTPRRWSASKWRWLFSQDQIYKFTPLFLVYRRQGHFPLSLSPFYLTSLKTSFVLLVFYPLLSFFLYLSTRAVPELLDLCFCLLLVLVLCPWWSSCLGCGCNMMLYLWVCFWPRDYSAFKGHRNPHLASSGWHTFVLLPFRTLGNTHLTFNPRIILFSIISTYHLDISSQLSQDLLSKVAPFTCTLFPPIRLCSPCLSDNCRCLFRCFWRKAAVVTHKLSSSHLTLTCHPSCTLFLLHMHPYNVLWPYSLGMPFFHLLCISKSHTTFHFFHLILRQTSLPSRTASAACLLSPDPLLPLFIHLGAKVPIKKSSIQGCFVDKFRASKRYNFRRDCLQSSFVCYSRWFLSLLSHLLWQLHSFEFILNVVNSEMFEISGSISTFHFNFSIMFLFIHWELHIHIYTQCTLIYIFLPPSILLYFVK